MVLTVVDDLIIDVACNKKLHPLLTELEALPPPVQKDVRVKTTHIFVMKTPNRWEL